MQLHWCNVSRRAFSTANQRYCPRESLEKPASPEARCFSRKCCHFRRSCNWGMLFQTWQLTWVFSSCVTCFPLPFTRTPWNRLTGEADDGAVRNRAVFFLFLIIFFFSMWKGLVNWSIDRSEFVVQVQMKSWCHASVTDNVSERGIQKTGKIYFDICDFVNWNFSISFYSFSVFPRGYYNCKRKQITDKGHFPFSNK